MNPNREEALFVFALEKLPEKRAAFMDRRSRRLRPDPGMRISD